MSYFCNISLLYVKVTFSPTSTSMIHQGGATPKGGSLKGYELSLTMPLHRNVLDLRHEPG